MRRLFSGIIFFTIFLCAAAQAYWQPAPGLRWQIQFSGTMDYSLDVDAFEVDLFDTPQADITALRERGIRVICYFSGGSWENWRPDAKLFPAVVKGRGLSGWPGEKWLDVRRIDILKPIMQARLDLAVSKKCDAVEADNVDGYSNKSGFALKGAHQLAYNRMLASEAHARGLAIGLKNDLGQIPQLVADFDFAVNESCQVWDECSLLLPFINAGKAVLHIEYTGDPAVHCPLLRQYRFNSLFKNRELDAHRVSCD
jgi:hypothetical protein